MAAKILREQMKNAVGLEGKSTTKRDKIKITKVTDVTIDLFQNMYLFFTFQTFCYFVIIFLY